MNKNIKTYIITFFVALLGAALGVAATLQINSKLVSTASTDSSSSLISKVEYTDSEPSNYSQMIQNAYNTVVSIIVTTQSTSNSYFFENTTSTLAGSGVIISSDGYIVTNNHVAENATSIVVTLYNGEQYEATTIGLDEKTDLALLKIDATGLNYASLASIDDVCIGDEVVAIGNPLNEGITVTKGIISSLSKDWYDSDTYMNVIQTDAAVNEGNSGGGLFDMNGNLVGIVNSKTMEYNNEEIDGIGYAIPCDTVESVINDLMNYGYVKNRPTLGISCYNSTYQYYYFGNTTGVVVASVVENEPAANAGIQANDIIVKMNDTDISTYSDLTKFMYNSSVGDKVTVSFYRNNQLMTVEVTLAEANQ